MSEVKRENLDVSFEQAKADKVGTVYVDRWEDGVRVRIIRGPCSLCAYIGIPATHPLAGMEYDSMPVQCHGGLTYSSLGGGTLPEGFFWYGWDYAHCGDKPFYDREWGEEEKAWTVKDVNAEIWSVIYDFKKLMALAEAAHAKGAGWRVSQ